MVHTSVNKINGTVPVALGFLKALKQWPECTRTALVTYDKPNFELVSRMFPELYAEPDLVISPTYFKAGLLDYIRLVTEPKLIVNTYADLIAYPGDVNYFHTAPLGVAKGHISLSPEAVFKLYETFVATPALNLTNSNKSRRELAKYGIKAKVLYPPVPRPPVPPRIGNKEGYVLYFGRISADKNVDLVLWLAERLPDRKFVVAGKPEWPYIEEFKRRARRLKNVELVLSPSAEEKWRLIQGAEVMVHPKKDEPFGIAPLEAVLAGTPALVPCSAGASEVLSSHIPCWEDEQHLLKLLKEGSYGNVVKAIRAVERCCSAEAFVQNVHKLLSQHIK